MVLMTKVARCVITLESGKRRVVYEISSQKGPQIEMFVYKLLDEYNI